MQLPLDPTALFDAGLSCRNVPPHILVFIPGYMGSRLKNQKTGELIWLDIPALLRDPVGIGARLADLSNQLKFPNHDLVPDGILNEVLFLPPFVKQEQYGRLIEQLTAWGYQINPSEPSPDGCSLYTFAYDWRQDNRLSARLLAQAIDQWRSVCPEAEIWIMGHSNGGIVARWYIEKEGGKDVVSRLFLLASPWDGAPKALQVMQDGLDVFLLRYFNRFGIAEILRETLLTFPSFYQLIPAFLPFLQDEEGRTIDLFRLSGWLKNANQNHFLRDAYSFNRELGTQLSVDTFCFYGVKRATTTRGVAGITPDGRLAHIDWKQTEDGDGTVPVHSALHPGATQKLPYPASHGDLYVYDAFLEKLRYELIDRCRYGALASVATSRLKAQFELDKDAYFPGESIQARAGLYYLENSLPVETARIELEVTARNTFPVLFSQDFNSGVNSEPTQVLMRPASRPGSYGVEIAAPQTPGYYVISATFFTVNDPPVHLEELFLVDVE